MEKIVSLVVERKWQGTCGSRFKPCLLRRNNRGVYGFCLWIANERGRKKKELTLENIIYVYIRILNHAFCWMQTIVETKRNKATFPIEWNIVGQTEWPLMPTLVKPFWYQCRDKKYFVLCFCSLHVYMFISTCWLLLNSEYPFIVVLASEQSVGKVYLGSTNLDIQQPFFHYD